VKLARREGLACPRATVETAENQRVIFDRPVRNHPPSVYASAFLYFLGSRWL